MLGPKYLEELSRQILDNLPDGLSAIQADVQQNMRASVTAAVNKLELVTREEFDVQVGVLRRTRERLEQLEARLATLEAKVASSD